MKASITGHQAIGNATAIEWVRNEINRLITRYAVTYGYTALAVGADQLFAECLRALGIPYAFVLPCRAYESTLKTNEALSNFRRLRSSAQEEIDLDYQEPSEDAFFHAGKTVVDRADLVFAVWNGKQAAGFGGTADVVTYALKAGKTVLHLSNTKLETSKLIP